MTFRLLPIFLTLVACAATAHAQLVTALRLSKTQYVAGEPVIAIVTITNHAGRDLVLQGHDRTQWLDFLVKRSNGEAVTSPRTPSFGSLKIGAGQSMAREVDLTQFFHLYDPGNFSVSAIIRMPGEEASGSGGTSTNRVLFNLNPGRPYWSQKVGLPGRPGQTREFRVLNFSGNQKSELYAQVIDNRTGMPVRTFLLGEALSLRKPSVTVDRSQRMHILFLSSPTMYIHCLIDTDGRLVEHKYHQRGPQGDPQLYTSAQGEVAVGNSIPYDPKAVAAEKAKQRKASDRPAFVYE